MTAPYPCPSCERDGTVQTEHRVARVWMHPGAIGHLQCPEHWQYVCGYTAPDDIHTVPFVIEQPAAASDADVLATNARLIAEIRNELESCRVVIRSQREEIGKFSSGLFRIMDAWSLADGVHSSSLDKRRDESSLFAVLRSVAREFVFSGEGGGK